VPYRWTSEHAETRVNIGETACSVCLACIVLLRL